VFEWEIHQIDIKGAYLNSRLNEPIYMLQPPGCVKDPKICLLHKTLYELKQSRYEWQKLLTTYLISTSGQSTMSRGLNRKAWHARSQTGMKKNVESQHKTIAEGCRDVRKMGEHVSNISEAPDAQTLHQMSSNLTGHMLNNSHDDTDQKLDLSTLENVREKLEV
jgi:hypothetical protein